MVDDELNIFEEEEEELEVEILTGEESFDDVEEEKE